MADWPANLKVGPIREWPGVPTARRRPSPFRYSGKPVKLTTTLSELDTELRAVHARGAELLVAIDPSKFRNDGRPYANAQATHPGVILSFELEGVGRVSYPCDTFTTWEDNLRAIVLVLNALRRIDRYGVAKHGDQYRGYLAIEATAAPAGFFTADEAIQFLAKVVESEWENGIVDTRPQNAKALLRGAQRRTHPDRGGDAGMFARVLLAEAKLREAGLL